MLQLKRLGHEREPFGLASECGHRGVSEVWQAKDLERGIFGSVAMAGLTGEFLEVWQGKDLKNERYGSNEVRV